jgi:hypothetical protein
MIMIILKDDIIPITLSVIFLVLVASAIEAIVLTLVAGLVND